MARVTPPDTSIGMAPPAGHRLGHLVGRHVVEQDEVGAATAWPRRPARGCRTRPRPPRPATGPGPARRPRRSRSGGGGCPSPGRRRRGCPGGWPRRPPGRPPSPGPAARGRLAGVADPAPGTRRVDVGPGEGGDPRQVAEEVEAERSPVRIERSGPVTVPKRCPAARASPSAAAQVTVTAGSSWAKTSVAGAVPASTPATRATKWPVPMASAGMRAVEVRSPSTPRSSARARPTASRMAVIGGSRSPLTAHAPTRRPPPVPASGGPAPKWTIRSRGWRGSGKSSRWWHPRDSCRSAAADDDRPGDADQRPQLGGARPPPGRPLPAARGRRGRPSRAAATTAAARPRASPAPSRSTPAKVVMSRWSRSRSPPRPTGVHEGVLPP